MKNKLQYISCILAWALVVLASNSAEAKIKVGYSDWPGWVAWEIGVQKGWFEEAGVDVEFVWFEYVPSMDAFAAGQIDAVCMTNGDALVTGATGKRSKAILINDYSNGNDMVVARPGIRKVDQLKGQKVGVELGFVGHLLLLKALEANGMKEGDVELVNMPTHETPQALASKGVDAIVAWQPNSGEALKMVTGSRSVYSSADSPGIIYDLLYVSNESLSKNAKDWQKVTEVWFRIADYIRDENNREDVLKIMSARVGLSPEEYAPFMKGTYIMDLAENIAALEDMDGLKSVYGSSRIVDEFNVVNQVYDGSENIESYLEPKFVKALAK